MTDWEGGPDRPDAITLRDYFAAAAMQTMASGGWSFGERANRAYEWADAMLKAREKG